MTRLITGALLLAMLALAPAAGQVQTVTICHATLDPDPPYIQLELSQGQLDAHRNHDLDIIPAGPAGCNINASSEEPEEEPEEQEPAPPTQTTAQPPTTSGQAPVTSAPPPAMAPTHTPGPAPAAGGLPYTGFDPAPLVLLGLAAMLAGAGVWYRWAGNDAVAAAWHQVALPRHLWAVRHERPEIRWREPEPPPAPAPPPRTELDDMRDVVARLEALRAELRDPDR